MTPHRRLNSIDAVRGAIMILMALDHVRDFVHNAAMTSSPTELTRTTAALFFTRWVTHFCAPGFMFTAGIGAFLWWQRGRTRKELSLFLLSRGLWLVVLELTVMHFAYDFDLTLRLPLLLLVLWGIGICMIVLAALVWLPERVLAIVSVAVIVLHNCLDGIRPAGFGHFAWIWNLLHVAGPFEFSGTTMITGYPLIPWFAVMALGFCAGRLFLLEPARRTRFLVVCGSAAIVSFVIVRALNVYGDPAPWSVQSSPVFSILSFFNTTKYPPSLAFLLMTLGPILLAFAYFERLNLSATNPLVIFGRVPWFYFIVHFFAAHLAAIVLAWFRYGGSALAFVFYRVPSMGGPAQLFPADFGYSLWVAYAVWASIVVGLCPACKWYAGLKAERHNWWMSYL